MKQRPQWRLFFFGGVFAFLAISIIVQMVRTQNSPQAQELLKAHEDYLGEYRTIYPPRGEILDRNGHLLAGNQTVYDVGVTLNEMENPNTIALALNVTLGLNYNAVYTLLTKPDEKQVYVQLADYVSAEKITELQTLKEQLEKQPSVQDGVAQSLAGLSFRAHLKRSYPENDLASNLLGFVTREGHGYYGIEEKYDTMLAGQPQTVWIPLDPNLAAKMPSLPGGSTLVLTIDREIQAAVEEILDNALVQTGSSAGTIIVLDPKTGEVLAMTSSPRLNLNEFWQYSLVYNSNTPFNRAISAQYEPGSVFKILTMAAALDTGTVAPTTAFFDPGYYEIGGVYVHNWDGGAWGDQDMVGCLEHSLNVCLAWIAEQLGTNNFYGYMQKFGMGHPTGIDLAGEAAGRLKQPGDEDWYMVDLGTNSFGQGVAVTPIQMAMAATAIANDGKMVVPHLVRSIVTNGYQYNTPTQVAATPISAQSARTLSEMLAQSLERGEGVASVPGYRLAGKTGTAQIPGPGGYEPNDTNASFVGWGPVDDPQFLVYVWMERPQTSEWASLVAAPIFQTVVEKLVVLMNIPPDNIRQVVAGQ